MFEREGYMPEKSARTLTMDPGQVRLILATFRDRIGMDEDVVREAAPPDDLRAERDLARSDLATERARSAGLTRALEMARGALARVAERGELTEWGFERGGKKCIGWVCHGYQGKYINVAPGDRCMNEHCVSVIASRALTAIDAVTGGGAGAAEPCAGCEKARHRDPRDGYCILHPPAAAVLSPEASMSVASENNAENRLAPSIETHSVTGGTPGAGEALSDGDGCQACVDGVDHVSCEPYFVPAPSIPVAQRRPAREAKLLEMGQACLDWAKDTGGCHFCDFGGLSPGSRPHAEDCPVREHSELPIEADRRGEP